MFSLHGIGIGGGVVVGRARRLERIERDVPRHRVAQAQVARELARLETAVEVVKAELHEVAEQLPENAPTEARALLDVHIMILEDSALLEPAREDVRVRLHNAEWAFAAQARQLTEQFEAFEDEYLRERGRDVRQVAERVARVLSGLRAPTVAAEEPRIYVATDLSPADMLSLRSALGFVLDQGGPTSHAAILARGMDVPAALGASAASRLIVDDDWLILDGEQGVVIVAPDEAILAWYRARQADDLRARRALRKLRKVPARTLDGKMITLCANIERPDEVAAAQAAGADGIGLFRSEFLFLNRRELPDEDEQYEAYRDVVLAMAGRPVTIRTLDVGADKALDRSAGVAVVNPALGRRAIRYCLAQPALFLAQLRAILRAAAHGPVRLLIPMLTNCHEIDQTMRLIGIARVQLDERGVARGADVPVGGMVEVPAAALSARLFVRRLDFLSIGTNDLTQYTLAIDRADHEVADLYEPFHPAVLQLVAMTIRAGVRAGKPVAVCGEMAGDAAATRLLLGMGLRELSMHPTSLLRVKREILQADVGRLRTRVGRLLRADDPIRLRAGVARLTSGV